MYNHIKQYAGNMELGSACAALGVGKRSYRAWLNRDPHPHPTGMTVRNEMQKIAVAFPRYGYRRMAKELQRRGFAINHKPVLALMRSDNLLCIKKRFRPQTTDSSHTLRVYPNCVKGLTVTHLNQLWVADITYVRLLTEFVYLAAIIDVFSRRCIGWELSRDIDAELALAALNKAFACRKGQDMSGLIHHSDRGIQYASDAYVNALRSRSIRISMSRKGNPYDNAFAESFMKTLKYEEVDMSEYESYGEARTNIRRFIDKVYNTKRLHSSIGYVPPLEFENNLRRESA
jgi:transposase InsO family protein